MLSRTLQVLCLVFFLIVVGTDGCFGPQPDPTGLLSAHVKAAPIEFDLEGKIVHAPLPFGPQPDPGGLSISFLSFGPQPDPSGLSVSFISFGPQPDPLGLGQVGVLSSLEDGDTALQSGPVIDPSGGDVC